MNQYNITKSANLESVRAWTLVKLDQMTRNDPNMFKTESNVPELHAEIWLLGKIWLRSNHRWKWPVSDDRKEKVWRFTSDIQEGVIIKETTGVQMTNYHALQNRATLDTPFATINTIPRHKFDSWDAPDRDSRDYQDKRVWQLTGECHLRQKTDNRAISQSVIRECWFSITKSCFMIIYWLLIVILAGNIILKLVEHFLEWTDFMK